MKKSIICGIASLAMATAPAFSAFATIDVDVDGDITKDVTVGEVDETVYSVDITWGNMAFDWKYDGIAKRFGFEGKHNCTQVGVGATAESGEPNFDGLYKDNMCTEPATEGFAGPFYANLLSGGSIDVLDNTTNGQVKIKASFTPENKYSWVTGKFSSVVYADNNGNFSQDLEDGYLVGVMGTVGHTAGFNGMLYLEGDDTHVTSDAVTANDKIGTVTLTIEPDLN